MQRRLYVAIFGAVRPPTTVRRTRTLIDAYEKSHTATATMYEPVDVKYYFPV